MNQQCKVCGEPAAGFHFGAFTCEGCKSFFGRTYNNTSSVSECKNNGGCVINKKNRTSCKSCRLRKCLLVGMSKSGSRYGRRSNWFKIHCLLQQQNSAPAAAQSPSRLAANLLAASRYPPPDMFTASPLLRLTPPSLADSPDQLHLSQKLLQAGFPDRENIMGPFGVAHPYFLNLSDDSEGLSADKLDERSSSSDGAGSGSDAGIKEPHPPLPHRFHNYRLTTIPYPLVTPYIGGQMEEHGVVKAGAESGAKFRSIGSRSPNLWGGAVTASWGCKNAGDMAQQIAKVGEVALEQDSPIDLSVRSQPSESRMEELRLGGESDHLFGRRSNNFSENEEDALDLTKKR